MGKKFYHADRKQSLQQGEVIDLVPVSETDIVDKQIAQTYYPDGVSSHGELYLSRMENESDASSFMIEAWTEVVRLLDFSEKTSRFQSVFGANSVEETREFAQRYPGEAEEATIWELECEDYELRNTFDLRYGVGQELLTVLRTRRRYWKEGANSPDQYPEGFINEVLAKPPITVNKKVETVELVD